ncbi:MAG: hypothetical protein ACREPK_00480 [Rhodanobacteraceae bacterium]
MITMAALMMAAMPSATITWRGVRYPRPGERQYQGKPTTTAFQPCTNLRAGTLAAAGTNTRAYIVVHDSLRRSLGAGFHVVPV